MHMRFLSRGFKNLQWYGMTQVHCNSYRVAVGFFYGRLRRFGRDGIMGKMNGKRENGMRFIFVALGGGPIYAVKRCALHRRGSVRKKAGDAAILISRYRPAAVKS